MGESKRRGSRSDRIKQAMERQRRDLQVALGAGFNPMTLEELRADVGVPASAVFCGYVLHRVEQDDFCSPDGRWVSFPGHALVVSDLPAAVSRFLELGLQSSIDWGCFCHSVGGRYSFLCFADATCRGD